ncbi:prokineticin-2 isoform X1 [Suricata suricatta]|uniref:prokineticin-2 isoform X1 n=1 Tax=Suricata suricatta TaxID=37032 RepID=UPI001155961E|nr:prokineticin-2 isoform X1 [Suricata suricatta]
MRGPRCAPLLLLLLLPPLLLTPPAADAAVITGVQERKPFVTKMEFYHIGYLSVREVSRGRACDKDPQCGGGMCCAVSIWVKSIRICTPMGKVGDNCHPLTRKNHFGNGRQERRKRKRRKRKKEVPFFGRRMHHTCPCMPGLACLRTSFNRFTCLARK